MGIENVISFIEFVEKRKAAKYILILLNIVLLVMLTHYCYVWTVKDYSLSSITSSAQVLEFFIHGDFLIPFIMFTLIWLTTEFVGTWVVNRFVSWILKFTMPLKRLIIENDSFVNIKWLRKLTELLSQDTVTRNAAWNQNPQLIEAQCALSQKFIRDALSTSVRFTMCVIIATICVKDFSIFLLLLTGVVVFVAFYAGRLFYMMFEVMPFFVARYQDAARRIYEKKKSKE